MVKFPSATYHTLNPVNQFFIYHIRKGMLNTQTFQISPDNILNHGGSRKENFMLIACSWKERPFNFNILLSSVLKCISFQRSSKLTPVETGFFAACFCFLNLRIFCRHWCWPCPSCIHLMGPIRISNERFCPLPNFRRLDLIYYLLSTRFVCCMQWQRHRYIYNVEYLIELHFKWSIPQ